MLTYSPRNVWKKYTLCSSNNYFLVRVWMCAHILVEGFGDELALAVNAGVGALASDLLLLLGDAAGGRRRAARMQGTWEFGQTGWESR